MPVERTHLDIPDSETDASLEWEQDSRNGINDAKDAIAAIEDGVVPSAATLSLTQTLAILMNAGLTGSPSSNATFMLERGTSPNVGFRWNETNDYWELTIDGSDFKQIATNTGGFLPYGYRGSGIPVYATATTFTVSHICSRDKTNAGDIIKNTSTTVDISTTGAGGIAQSANLTGTVTVTNGSAVVTFSTSQAGVLQIGDVIRTNGGQIRKLISGSGTSWTADAVFTSDETTVAFKRGGRRLGTFYYLYECTGPTGTTLVLSTRDESQGHSMVDLPTGYDVYYRQSKFYILLTGSGDILEFKVMEGWPQQPHIRYNTFQTGSGNGFEIVSATTQTSWATASAANLLPPMVSTAELFTIVTRVSSAVGGFIRPKGTSLSTGIPVGVAVDAPNSFAEMLGVKAQLDANSELEWQLGNSGGHMTIAVMGGIIDKVA